MYRVIMLAALMLSLMGGLWVMSGSAPLAAQTTPSASRSFSPATVAPDGQVTVTIAATGYGQAGGVTEMLPAGFVYESSSLADSQVLVTGQMVRFTLQGDESFTYIVTAPSTEGPYTFSGMLRDFDRGNHEVGGDTEVTVSTDTGPAPVDVGELQFDVVKTKAVKGAVVSGLKSPIDSSPLEWDVSDEVTGELVSIANYGVVGDFQVKDEGSGKFRLYVMNSGAPALSGTQSINVAVTYDDDTVVNLTGDITERNALAFTNSSL